MGRFNDRRQFLQRAIAAGTAADAAHLRYWMRLGIALARQSPQHRTALQGLCNIPGSGIGDALRYAHALGILEPRGHGWYAVLPAQGEPMENQYVAYTIMDGDTGERFSTTDWLAEQDGLTDAHRERNRLVIRYGKEFCLLVAGIDTQGLLHEID